ncbi:hypothetical protein CPB84DRAFT_1852160 [Gymnopilus junonius]|uniref:Uncharacterized protein n=1 Tax=Gymnopilus junonius TaxID=109634 RepID=A0A9P5NAX7_GYMJU|nr:hypothetical protein CPB84DRAFT_1852160 [Gymnopilus junonius]
MNVPSSSSSSTSVNIGTGLTNFQFSNLDNHNAPLLNSTDTSSSKFPSFHPPVSPASCSTFNPHSSSNYRPASNYRPSFDYRPSFNNHPSSNFRPSSAYRDGGSPAPNTPTHIHPNGAFHDPFKARSDEHSAQPPPNPSTGSSEAPRTSGKDIDYLENARDFYINVLKDPEGAKSIFVRNGVLPTKRPPKGTVAPKKIPGPFAGPPSLIPTITAPRAAAGGRRHASGSSAVQQPRKTVRFAPYQNPTTATASTTRGNATPSTSTANTHSAATPLQMPRRRNPFELPANMMKCPMCEDKFPPDGALFLAHFNFYHGTYKSGRH